jgi:hypothetical protein
MVLDASGNLSIGTASATANTGINVYSQKAIFGSGGGTTGPRGGFYSTATEIYMGLDDSVQADGTGFLVGSDYFYIRRTSTTGTTDFNNNSSTGSLTFGTGASGTTRLTISSTGAATFTGTVTVKSNSGSGTGYAPAIYNATLSGDGSTTAFTVTHNFSNPKPIVQVWQKGSPYGLVYADITSNSTGTTTTITFATAPASGTDYWVTVLG